jgi:mannose-6-phosphate isomerase-like protein (cupin superfamily)
MHSEPGVASVSPAAEAVFTRKPQRPCLEFRDLGIAAATGGATMAQIVRAVARSEGAQVPHYHEGVELQFFYVIAGSMTVDYAGEICTLGAGDAVVQPERSVHAILDHSADLELLEVTIPPTYTTVAQRPR